MSSSYPGNIPDWLEYNKTFVSEVFPSRPQPWHMAQRRVLAKETGKVTLVRKPISLNQFALSTQASSNDLDYPLLVTCLDPRCVPETFFGPDFDGGVIRNAGGRATDDAIRSLTILRGLAGLRNVVVIHHTGRWLHFRLYPRLPSTMEIGSCAHEDEYRLRRHACDAERNCRHRGS